jgi:hypothetical protein
MKKLKVDWSMLELAFDDSSYEHSHFLDLETGEVVFITDEEREYAESFGDSDDEDDAGVLNAASSESADDLSQWMRDAAQRAAEVRENPDRYEVIPRADSREGYRDMQVFIDSVSDERIAELLDVAIQGSGAFRRFKDVLARFPAERERYFQFRDDRVRARIRDWLHSLDIDLCNLGVSIGTATRC